MECSSQRIPGVLRMLREEYARFPIDTRDGVKVMLPEGWFLVRGSNTEPIIRIVAESRSEDGARKMVSDVYEQVTKWIAA
jgi:phosphomannomutase